MIRKSKRQLERVLDDIAPDPGSRTPTAWLDAHLAETGGMELLLCDDPSPADVLAGEGSDYAIYVTQDCLPDWIDAKTALPVALDP